MYIKDMKLAKKFLIAGVLIFLIALLNKPVISHNGESEPTLWLIQSIDTMKYSRDPAREKIKDPNFKKVIDDQVKKIASTGANYVAIATPYDQEFVPFLKEWVSSARKNNLHVWFRGNLSGWEGWFNYPKISKSVHNQKIKEFILANEDLFQDGDIFSSCPECENGGTGDPRQTGDIISYRNFLISEYRATQDAFTQIHKNVYSNFFSMNADVANLVMDQQTTKALGGIVVIDHYVSTPQKLVTDIVTLSQKTGGKIVLGEWGAPIPDINGQMNEREQANWIHEVLDKLSETKELIGLNYWVNLGGSTSIWNDDGTQRQAVQEITNFYTSNLAKGSIDDEIDKPIEAVKVNIGIRTVLTDKNGYFEIPNVNKNMRVDIQMPNYESQTLDIANLSHKIVLIRQNNGIIFKIKKFLHLLHII
ncbi:hypothetical protein HYS03_00785 [Candidatus Woesebacteria bacterium]|nr:hypothetical protein [Candidatus Woesebacteria bacterium]QQG47198.1 MAG: hypothetical protein HY044_03600 [Candidatus Woesebacteria bacterium]